MHQSDQLIVEIFKSCKHLNESVDDNGGALGSLQAILEWSLLENETLN